MPPFELDVFLHDTYLVVSDAGRWFLVAMLFVFGGIIGSFMNVVVYRMPRGMSLSHPGSRCPACDHPIRWYDNVPIFGWLLLGGRCRDCRAPISPRYPTVEALVAGTSALLGWAALVPDNRLPVAGDMFIFSSGLYAMHFLLMCTLVCAALMDLDGHPAPARMWLPVLVIVFAAGSFWPDLRPNTAWSEESLRGVFAGAAGLFAALVLGALAWPVWVDTARRSAILAGTAAVAELALVGVVLGFRDVAVVGAASMLCYVAMRVAGRVWEPAARPGWAASLGAVTLVRILTRPSNGETWPFIAGHTDMTILVIAGGIVACVSAAKYLGLVPARRLEP